MPAYAIPNVALDHVPVSIGLPVGRMRGGAHGYTAFMIESFIDEIAHRHEQEPMAFRIAMLGHDVRLAMVRARMARETLRMGIQRKPRRRASVWAVGSIARRGEGGTRLLTADQDSIAVLGVAFGALRLGDQTITLYRQLINRPFINPQDNRMVPNTFEAYTLSGAGSGLSYTGGYIAKMKTRASDSFDWMSTAAGSTGPHKGVGFAGVTWDFMKNGSVRVDEQYGTDLFNTIYVDGKYPIAIDAQTLLVLGAQYTSQKSIGKEYIGSFSTYHAGAQAVLSSGPFSAQLNYTQNGKGFDSQNPFGDHPSYLNLMQVPFNTAGEKTWGLGGNVNFASLGAPGLTASAIYASSNGRINAANGALIPDRQETDLRADYAFAKGTPLAGLVGTLRGGWLHQDGSPTAFQLRIYVNYVVPF